MVSSRIAALGVLASLAAGAVVPASASQGSFCQRIDAKLHQSTNVTALETRLRRVLRRAALEGCDLRGGMSVDVYCLQYTFEIRRIAREIRQTEIRVARPDNLRALYSGANCDQRPSRSKQRQKQPGAGGVVARSRLPQEGFAQPVIERFIPISRVVAEVANAIPEGTANVPAVATPEWNAEEYAYLKDTRPIPENRKHVRIVGPAFLPEAGETEFWAIARSEPGVAEGIIHRVVAFVGAGFVVSGEAQAAVSDVDEMTTSAVSDQAAEISVAGAKVVGSSSRE